MTTKTAPWIAIGLCLLAAMLEGFDIASMGVAAPKMIPALGLSKPEAGWAFSASLFGLLFGALMAGPAADRVGRKPVLLVAVVAYGLFSLATAFAGSLGPLLGVRFLTGLGLGGAMPMLIAMASELASPRRRAFTVGLITAGLPMGGALVGLVARSDLAQADWRVIFIIGGVAPLLLAGLLVLLLPETRAKSADDVVTGEALHALFGRERLATTASLWIGYGAMALVLHLFLNWLPSLLVERGLQGRDAAAMSVLFNLGGAAGGMLAGLAIDRFGSRWPFAAIFAALIAALFVLAGAAPAMMAAMSFAAGFLIMAGQFGLYAVGPDYYGPSVRGVGVGAAVSAGRLGSVFGPLAAGQLLGAGISSGQVVMATVPIVLLAAIAAVGLSIWGRKDVSPPAPLS